jgi:hypothetical protein
MKKLIFFNTLSLALFLSLISSVCFSRSIRPDPIAKCLIDTSKNISPTVVFNSPTDSATYTTDDENIKLNVSATDLDGIITKVEFYNGANLLNTDSIFPYEYLWTGFRVGDYSIIAKATDNRGSVTTSAINIFVVQGEIPTIEEPLSAFLYWGMDSIVVLSVVVADDDGEENLTYTWSVIGTPPAPVTFYGDRSLTSATVQKAGAYSFLVTIKDRTNHTVTSSATVTILRDVSDCNSIVDILPQNITATVNSQVQFYNVSVDQFDDLDTTTGTPTFHGSLFGYGIYLWGSASGGDRINKYSGIYRAPGTPGKDTVFMEAWVIDYMDSSFDRIKCKPPHYSVITIVDSKLPTVKITHPLNRSRHTAPAYFELSADATDDDGSIKKVDFYNGSNLIFTETVAPFQRKGYVIAEAGTYSLFAKATDNDGNVTTSDTANIIVVPNGQPPTVKITHPLDGSRHLTPAYLELSANATDEDGTIKKVDFYNGSNLIFTEMVAPYQRTNYVLTEPGKYSLTAKATDNKGNVTTSDVVHINVVPKGHPPLVNITSPVNGSKHTIPAYFTLSADAIDLDGTIKKVEFYNGTNLIFTETVAPYQRKGYVITEAGDYSLTAKATDNSGNVTISSPVNIKVIGNRDPGDNFIFIGTFNGHDYYKSTLTYLGYQADALAFSLGGHLATITSQSENDFIYNNAIQDHNGADVDGYWIGFTDSKVEGSFVWSNGEPVTYTNWSGGEPNDADEGEDYAEMLPINGKWNDFGLSNAIKFILEFEPVTAGAKTSVSKPVLLNSKTNISDVVSLTLAPNPANNILNIYTTGLQRNKQLFVSVISASGATVKTLQTNSSTQILQLDVSSLASGVYNIKLVSGEKILYKKFVKQ